MSPIGYSIGFAANCRRHDGGRVAARLAGRVATRTVILTGQVAALLAGIAMLADAPWFDAPLLHVHGQDDQAGSRTMNTSTRSSVSTVNACRS